MQQSIRAGNPGKANAQGQFSAEPRTLNKSLKIENKKI
jgi:hypothetical protein